MYKRQVRGLTGPTDPSVDADAFTDVGKIGLGDIEISDDGTTLYVMNLSSNELVAIDVATMMITNSWLVPDPGCVDGVFRPFAVAYEDGEVYIGGVCDGSLNASNPQNLNDVSARQDLEAFVYRLDGASFTEVKSTPLDYLREPTDAYNGSCNPDINGWYGWVDQLQATCNGSVISYPQPMLTDIEFDAGGNMVISFADRTGFQIGNNNLGPDGTGSYSNTTGGDILYACNNLNGFWTIEGSGCTNAQGGAINGSNNTCLLYTSPSPRD